MRALIQRVSRAKVSVDQIAIGEIGSGLVVLLGVTHADSEAEASYLVNKILNLRVFDDSDGVMNLSLVETRGDILVISQFTLYGSTRKGRRPSYVAAAASDHAKMLYEFFIAEVRKEKCRVETGQFQAIMDVELVNNGPVTLMLDTLK